MTKPDFLRTFACTPSNARYHSTVVANSIVYYSRWWSIRTRIKLHPRYLHLLWKIWRQNILLVRMYICSMLVVLFRACLPFWAKPSQRPIPTIDHTSTSLFTPSWQWLSPVIISLTFLSSTRPWSFLLWIVHARKYSHVWVSDFWIAF